MKTTVNTQEGAQESMVRLSFRVVRSDRKAAESQGSDQRLRAWVLAQTEPDAAHAREELGTRADRAAVFGQVLRRGKHRLEPEPLALCAAVVEDDVDSSGRLGVATNGEVVRPVCGIRSSTPVCRSAGSPRHLATKACSRDNCRSELPGTETNAAPGSLGRRTTYDQPRNDTMR